MANTKENKSIPQVPEHSKKEVKYVVVRIFQGIQHRVSDLEYPSAEDGQEEASFWKRVVSRYPDGTKVDVVPYDSRVHRTW